MILLTMSGPVEGRRIGYVLLGLRHSMHPAVYNMLHLRLDVVINYEKQKETTPLLNYTQVAGSHFLIGCDDGEVTILKTLKKKQRKGPACKIYIIRYKIKYRTIIKQYKVIPVFWCPDCYQLPC